VILSGKITTEVSLCGTSSTITAEGDPSLGMAYCILYRPSEKICTLLSELGILPYSGLITRWVDGPQLTSGHTIFNLPNLKRKNHQGLRQSTTGDPPRLIPDWTILLDSLMDPHPSASDGKSWSLTANGRFSVKSLYNFLNEDGLRCQRTLVILKGHCLKKINLSNWLAWDNKILTLKNLPLRRCN